MRKAIAVILLCAVITLSGCQKDVSVPDSVSEPPGRDTSSESSYSSPLENTPSGVPVNDDPDLYLKGFSFRANFMICDRGSDRGDIYWFKTPLDGQLKISVLAGITPDESISNITPVIRIYVLGDGKPLKFKIPNSPKNGSLSTVHDIIPQNLSDFSTDIDIDLTSHDEIETLAVILNIYPDYIPQKGLGAFSGCFALLVQNAECPYKLAEYGTDSGGYYAVASNEMSIDIGETDIADSEKIVENHFYNDITIDPQNKSVFVKFNSGNKHNIPFHLILFRDGELLDAFDGEYSKIVNCLSGERTFQFKIPDKYIPDDGLHTFQAVAVPAYAFPKDSLSDNIESYIDFKSTNKTRVLIS